MKYLKDLRIKRTTWISVFLLLAAVLCACGGHGKADGRRGKADKEENGGVTAGGEHDAGWKVSEEDAGAWTLSDSRRAPEGTDPRYLLFREDSLIYMSKESSGYECHLCDFSGENPAEYTDRVIELRYPGMPGKGQEDAEAVKPESAYLIGVSREPSGADKLWALWRGPSEADPGGVCELVQYGISGEVLSRVELRWTVVEDNSRYLFYAAKEGENYYFLSEGKLTVIAGDGRVMASQETPGTGVILALGDQYYLVGSEGERTSVGRLGEGGVEPFCEIPLHGELFAAGEDGKLYLSTGNQLYRCDLENREAGLVLRWDDADLNFMEFRSLVGAGDGQISVYGWSDGAVLWSVKPSDMADTRTRVTLVANLYDWHLSEWIYNFNQTNDSYKIVIEDYGLSELDGEDRQNRLRLLLASAEPPDLVDLSAFDNWEELAKQGAFADLSPYIEAGSPIREEDYLPNIWAWGQVSGKQIFIPYSISFSLLFGQERYVGSNMGWTLAELLAVSREHEDIAVLPYYNAEAYLNTLLTFGLEEFVDFSGGTCDFENPLFYDLLECCGRVREYDPSRNKGGQTALDEVLGGDALLGVCWISYLEDYLACQSVISVGGETVQLALKGYPSKDGQPKGYGDWTCDRYAVCAGSDCKEGAWSFVEYVIEETWGDGYSLFHIPAKTERLREWLSHKKENVQFANYKKLGLKFEDPSPEEVERMFDMIGRLEFESGQNDRILQIIEEEAQGYFAGQRSKEDVAGIIQNRVRLYLREQG